MNDPSDHRMSSFSHSPHPIPSTVQDTQKFGNAIEFLGQVRRVYESQPHIYHSFIRTIKDFQFHMIDASGVINRVKSLFTGHPELVLGFNAFFPGIKLEVEPEQPSAEFNNHNLDFGPFKRQTESSTNNEETKAHIEKHEDAQEPTPAASQQQPQQEEFQRQHLPSLLPLVSQKMASQPHSAHSISHPYPHIARPYQPHYSSIHHSHQFISQPFQFSEQDTKEHKDQESEYHFSPYRTQDLPLFRESENQYQRRSSLHPPSLHMPHSAHSPHLSHPFQPFPTHSQFPPFSHSPHPAQIPIQPLHSQQNQNQPQRTLVTGERPNLQPVHQPPATSHSHKAHAHGLQHLQPIQTPSIQPRKQSFQQQPRPELDHARNFVKKIKVRFSTKPHIYQAFLKILHHKDQQSITDVYSQVAELFSDHPELLAEFREFLPDPNAKKEDKVEIKHEHESTHTKNSPIHTGGLEKQQRAQRLKRKANPSPPPKSQEKPPINIGLSDFELFVRIKFAIGTEKWTEFLKVMNLYLQNILPKRELGGLFYDLTKEIENSKLFQDLCSFLGINPSDYPLPARSPRTDGDVEMDSEISSESEDYPEPKLGETIMSYRHIEEEPQPNECGGRTELDTQISQVLNDEWIAVPPSKKFKIGTKSPLEELLFDCEDQRFELDLIFSRFDDLKNTLQQILTAEEVSELSLIQSRTLSQLYSNEGPNVVSLFVQNPRAVAPIVLKRLEQKEEEWKVTKEEYENQWKKIYNEKEQEQSVEAVKKE